MKEKIKIIIAEDQKLYRDAIISVLKEFNIITIGEAQNGLELLALLKTKKPDLILLDIEMPFMDGNETLTKVTEEFPSAKIIILSQYNSEELIKNYILRGARGYFTKDTDIRILSQGIMAVKINGIYHDNIRHIFDEKKNYRLKNSLLSRREVEIINLMCQGKSSKQIASDLHIVTKTVEAHRKDIYKKSKTQSLSAFIAFAVKEGLYYLKTP